MPLYSSPGGEPDAVHFTVDTILDNPAGLLFWLPGGPNSYSTVAYVARQPELREMFDLTSQIVALDPPRDSQGSWAGQGCVSDLDQASRFEGILSDPNSNREAAQRLAWDCGGRVTGTYSIEEKAMVLAAVASFLGAAEVDLYAASADSLLLPTLAASGLTIRNLILDSPVGPAVSGLDFVTNQVQSALHSIEPLLGVRPESPELASAVEAAEPDDIAFLLSLLKVPGVSASERFDILDGRTASEVLSVADQYFRRFASGRYSPLNQMYLAGLCPAMDWEDERSYLEALSAFDASAIEIAVARFVFNYHLPCLEWQSAVDPPIMVAAPVIDGASVVLGSRLDPVVGFEPALQWADLLDIPAHDVASVGHGATVLLTDCRASEILAVGMEGSAPASCLLWARE